MENENKLLALKRTNAFRALPAQRFTEYNNYPKLLEYCTFIAQSEFSPFSKPEDVAAALLWANAKGVSEIDALSHLLIVNGKAAPDSYLTGALVMKESSITYNVKKVKNHLGNYVREDCRPLYIHTTKGGNRYTTDDIDAQPDLFQIVTVEQVQKNIGIDDKKLQVIRSADPYDYRTIVEFQRQIRLPDGSYRIIEEEGEFKYSEAVTADLAKKDVWQKYLKDMLFNRAFTRGARRIAKDLLLKDNAIEMMDMNNIPYEVMDGEVVEITDSE